MKKRSLIVAIALVLAICLGVAAWSSSAKSGPEVDALAVLLDWRPGQTVAEIGAGKGSMTISAAQRVGPTGRVFSTELNPERLAGIQTAASKLHLANVTTIQGGESSTNLPRACCDSIFMRFVYHHFTHPVEIDASLLGALKPGGRLAVIDFRPTRILSVLRPVNGVPSNRGGHGIPKQVLIDELTGAGFALAATPPDWPGPGYCVVFRKPAP